MEDDGKELESLATEYQYTEVPCQRGVSGAQFSQGVQDYVFSIAAPQAWSPERSYFRAEVEILRKGPAPGFVEGIPRVSDGIALAEGAMNNAYANAYFLAAGVSASNITNYLAVAAQLKARTQKTGAWLNTVGKSAWGMTASLSERIAAVSVVSGTAGAVGAVGLSGLDDCREIIYKPIPFAAGPPPVAPATFATETVSRDPVTGIVTPGSAAVVFSAADIGATLVIAGARHTILSLGAAGPPQLVLTEFGGPAAVATADWYVVKRENLRSDQVRNKLQVLFRPPIGIMDYPDLLGAGQYRFQLSPDANFASSAVETFNPVLTSAGYTFNVLDVKFYAAVVKIRIPDSVHTLHLKEYLIQSKVMNTPTQNLSWSVPASTTSIHVFLQDQAAGSTPYSPPSRFTVANGSDLNLESIQLTYSNLSKPMTRWTSRFAYETPDVRNVAELQQFYEQGLIENQMEHDSAETFNEWLTRGPLYSFRYERDAADRSTDVQLQISYRDPGGLIPTAFTPNSKVFLCACYDRAVEITHDKGLIVGVRSLDV